MATLLPAVLGQFDSFEHALRFLDAASDDDIRCSAARYSRFMAARERGVSVAGVNAGGGHGFLTSSGTADATTPIDVEVVWRTHLLHPQCYAEACAWLRVAVAAADADWCPPPCGWCGLDLVAAVRRQQCFMRRVLEARDVLQLDSPAAATAAIGRYVQFLRELRCAPTLVPTLPVDVVWHTHQMRPLRYAADCLRIVGRRVNHDDSTAPPADVPTMGHWPMQHA